MIQFTFKAGEIWNLINNHMLTDDFRCISEEKDLFDIQNLSFCAFEGIHYPFKENSIDVITTRYAFHHFPEIETVI